MLNQCLISLRGKKKKKIRWQMTWLPERIVTHPCSIYEEIKDRIQSDELVNPTLCHNFYSPVVAKRKKKKNSLNVWIKLSTWKPVSWCLPPSQFTFMSGILQVWAHSLFLHFQRIHGITVSLPSLYAFWWSDKWFWWLPDVLTAWQNHLILKCYEWSWNWVSSVVCVYNTCRK